MNKWVEILIGLVLLNLSIYAILASAGWGFWSFRSAAWAFLKGGFIWAVLFAGVLFVILGISDLKN
jgi:hypothetical protein